MATAWLLTFRCYGTWLPGDRRGYIEHAPGGKPYAAPPQENLEIWTAQRLPRPAYLLDAAARAVVGTAIRDHCVHAGWVLRALHVGNNHVHVVLQGEGRADRMMNALKACATRYLRKARLIDGDMRPWARHGSTVLLRTEGAVVRACRYVVEGQGAPLDTDAGMADG